MKNFHKKNFKKKLLGITKSFSFSFCTLNRHKQKQFLAEQLWKPSSFKKRTKKKLSNRLLLPAGFVLRPKPRFKLSYNRC
jgi:hypothetical protein